MYQVFTSQKKKQKNVHKTIQPLDGYLLASDLYDFVFKMMAVVHTANKDNPKCKQEAAYSNYHEGIVYIGITGNNDKLLITLIKVAAIV